MIPYRGFRTREKIRIVPQSNGHDLDEEAFARVAGLLRQGPPATPAARRALRDLIGRLDTRSRGILQSDPELTGALRSLDIATSQDLDDARRRRRRRVLPMILAAALVGVIGFMLLLSAEIVSASSLASSPEEARHRRLWHLRSPVHPHRLSHLDGRTGL
jgi:transposase